MAGKGSVNKVIILGNLGADPELKYTASGAAVTTLSMATTESWKDDSGNRQERTEWHRVVLWRRLAEIAGEYLKKGSKIYVEGKLQTRSWEDKDGNKRYTTEIVGDVMTMLDSRGDSGGGRAPSPPPASDTEAPPATGDAATGDAATGDAATDDDLPF